MGGKPTPQSAMLARLTSQTSRMTNDFLKEGFWFIFALSVQF
jgi:hypothetical protein